uniref:SET domain-containing protein n=1 Tax=Scylla olivacea TaxID=85551 RepID=A0A0P4WM27_SCYOL
MESHAERRRQENEPHTEIAVAYFTKVLDAGWDEEMVRHVHGAIITNAINTYGARREALRGLYTTLYLMNHSCCPNVTIRSEPDGTVYARAAVPIKKGQPLLFSYLPPSDPLWRRQGDLTSLYYFRCNCERCIDHTELGTYFSSPLCPQCSGGFLEPYEGGGRPWSCPECGEEQPEEEVARQAEEYVKRIQKESTDMEAALQMLTDAANTFHTNHFVWLTAAQMVLHHLQDSTTPHTLSVRRDLWQRIIGLYQRLEPGATRRKGESGARGRDGKSNSLTMHASLHSHLTNAAAHRCVAVQRRPGGEGGGGGTDGCLREKDAQQGAGGGTEPRRHHAGRLHQDPGARAAGIHGAAVAGGGEEGA